MSIFCLKYIFIAIKNHSRNSQAAASETYPRSVKHENTVFNKVENRLPSAPLCKTRQKIFIIVFCCITGAYFFRLPQTFDKRKRRTR